MTENELVYVIMATAQINGDTAESWVHCVCRDNLTAEGTCAKLNKEDQFTEYHIEEHEIYG